MKKLLFPLLLFQVLASLSLQAQVLPDYYKKYYIVRSVHSTGRAWDQNLNSKSGNPAGNVMLYSYHGNANQQWVIMPTYLKADNGVITLSNDYIIASRHDGDVMAVLSSTYSNQANKVSTSTSFDGSDNQVFRLTNAGSPDIFFINSPYNVNRYLDMNLGNSTFYGDLVYYPFHGNNNQKFRLVTFNNFQSQLPPIRSRVTVQPPTPPAPESFSQSLITETPKFFKSETLLPFPMIKNDHAPFWQVQYSQYYRLVRSQFYRLADAKTWMPGEGTTITVTTSKGMTSTKVTEVSEKMNVSFTSSGEVGVTFLGLSLKAGKSISSGLELTTKTITSFEETSLQSISIEYTFQAPNPVRLVTYQLIDYYELFRQDGTLVSDWEVLTPQAHRVQYPSEEDYGGRSSSGTSFIMEDGAIIPIYNTVETSDKISDDSNSELDETFKIQLSPNPTTEKINLTYNSSALEEAEIYIYIYTQAGTLHRQEKLQSSTAGNSVDISDLPTGLYFVKVISGKHSSTTRIFKE